MYQVRDIANFNEVVFTSDDFGAAMREADSLNGRNGSWNYAPGSRRFLVGKV